MPPIANYHGFIRFNGRLACVRCGAMPHTFTTAGGRLWCPVCEPTPNPNRRWPVPSDVIEYTTRSRVEK